MGGGKIQGKSTAVGGNKEKGPVFIKVTKLRFSLARWSCRGPHKKSFSADFHRRYKGSGTEGGVVEMYKVDHELQFYAKV